MIIEGLFSKFYCVIWIAASLNMVIPGMCARIWRRLTLELESVELEMKRVVWVLQ